jgi:hypothetical protein
VAKVKERINPFYVVLVVAGAVFVVTACAYGVMAFKALGTDLGDSQLPGRDLLVFLDQYGVWLLGSELAILALATFAAIGLDDYRIRKRTTDRSPSSGQASARQECGQT